MDDKQAKLLLRGETISSRINIPVWKAMKENGFSISAYLAIRNGILITTDEILKLDDMIELIPVVSGG